MKQYNRYAIAKLANVFGLYALIFAGILWANQAIVLFDTLSADSPPAWIYGQYLVIILPEIMLRVMPLSSFAAGMAVTYRMNMDSELVVLRATGFSPYRLLKPFLIFGLFLAALSGALNHHLVPMAEAELTRLETEVKKGLTTGLIKPGRFVHPSGDLTIFVGDISESGEMTDILVNDSSGPDTNYITKKAYLARNQAPGASPEQDGGLRLVMQDGMTQIISRETRKISTVRFTQVAFDLTPFLSPLKSPEMIIGSYPSLQLLASPAEVERATGKSRAAIHYELHDRLAKTIYPLVFMLFGAVALMIGNYVRIHPYWHMAATIAVMFGLYSITVLAKDMTKGDISRWPYIYLSTVIGIVIIQGILVYLAKGPHALRMSLPIGAFRRAAP